MKIGVVAGNVWSSRKDEGLVGVKLLIISLQDREENNECSRRVAADLIGAGIGEKVLITEGSSARNMRGLENSPVDAIVVGIIDEEKIGAL
ncbi:ethanolamine utilization protein EutN [Desulfitispora alkaliphila]|uniref:EutN/CcmL family microcompartment protein n=1 Tax=Desulfitispora alkaliphila TaxID=622674 RepID=UPI003D2289CF